MTKKKKKITYNNKLSPEPQEERAGQTGQPPGEEYVWTPTNTNFKNQKDYVKEQSSKRTN